MPVDPLFSAAICAECQHVALLADAGNALLADAGDGSACPLCSAKLLLLPGVKFVHGDLVLFTALERVVHDAKLSTSEATLVAAELESVSGRWEPPDLALQRLSQRLDGLSGLYDAQQDYSRLLLVVSMLLTIVGSRLILDRPAPKAGNNANGARSRRPSGVRELARPGSTPEGPPSRASAGRKPSG